LLPAPPAPCLCNGLLKVSHEQSCDLLGTCQLSPPKACSITSIFQMVNFSFSVCNTEKTLPFPFIYFFFILISLKMLQSDSQQAKVQRHTMSPTTHFNPNARKARAEPSPPSSCDGHSVFHLIMTKTPWPAMQIAFKTACEGGIPPKFGVPQQTSAAACSKPHHSGASITTHAPALLSPEHTSSQRQGSFLLRRAGGRRRASSSSRIVSCGDLPSTSSAKSRSAREAIPLLLQQLCR